MVDTLPRRSAPRQSGSAAWTRSQQGSPGDRDWQAIEDQRERRRSPRWAAWSLWALTMLLVALAGVIVAASPAASRYAQESELGYLIFAVLFSTVGVVSVRVAGGQGAMSAAGLTGPRNLWRARRA